MLEGLSRPAAVEVLGVMFGPGKLDGLTTVLVHETPTYGATTDLFELAFHLVDTEDILDIHWDVQLHTTEGLLRRVLIAAPVFLKGPYAQPACSFMP